MNIINRLDWDSDFFGYEVGKMEIENVSELNERLFRDEARKFKLIYLFSKEKLIDCPLHLSDEKIIFSRNLESSFSAPISLSDYTIVSFDEREHGIDQLRKLALKSGIYSRFYTDPNFKNNEYSRLYHKWIDESVNKKMAFDILVAIKDRRILGFITLAKKSNKLVDIGLVAVDDTVRGQGVASNIIQYAMHKMHKMNYEEIQVVTQGANIPAVNLYKKLNFNIQQKHYIYHYWNL